MSATDELRRMLDERGVEWVTYGNTDRVWWTTENGSAWYAQDRPSVNGSFVKIESVITPEQAIAATLGSGKLTAEQVREIVDRHWHDLPTERDMPETTALPEYSYNWHAIADELNATLENGTCELAYGEDDEGYDGWYTRCGGWFAATREDGRIIRPLFCQLCGNKVVVE